MPNESWGSGIDIKSLLRGVEKGLDISIPNTLREEGDCLMGMELPLVRELATRPSDQEGALEN